MCPAGEGYHQFVKVPKRCPWQQNSRDCSASIYFFEQHAEEPYCLCGECFSMLLVIPIVVTRAGTHLLQRIQLHIFRHLGLTIFYTDIFTPLHIQLSISYKKNPTAQAGYVPSAMFFSGYNWGVIHHEISNVMLQRSPDADYAFVLTKWNNKNFIAISTCHSQQWCCSASTASDGWISYFASHI